jgi:hypothetical protein
VGLAVDLADLASLHRCCDDDYPVFELVHSYGTRWRKLVHRHTYSLLGCLGTIRIDCRRQFTCV